MKKGKGMLIALLMASLCLCCQAALADTTYYGEAQGFAGTVSVYVTVNDSGELVDIAAYGPNETIGKGSVALEQLPPAMVAANNTDVDALSGATITSNAIKTAVDAALENKQEAELPAQDAQIAYTPGT